MDGDKSREDYLEAILVLSKKNETVRNVDIAAYLGFAAPSVSIAIKKLAQEKYIFIDDNKAVVLTPKGRLKAEQIYERHLVLTLIDGAGCFQGYCGTGRLQAGARFKRRILQQDKELLF